MLSQNERRQLQAIERELAAEDPRLAVTLRAGQFERYRWVFTVMWIFGAGCFVLGCFTGSLILVSSGIAFGATGLGFWYRRKACRAKAAE
jgi:Protein of unknown function (DUF3040)